MSRYHSDRLCRVMRWWANTGKWIYLEMAMCEELKALDDAVTVEQQSVWSLEDELSEARRDLHTAEKDQKDHPGTCPNCDDPWAEHQALEAIGQTDLLKANL